MIIQRLGIGSFGKLAKLDLELKPNLNLIVGNNESGKTTLSTFVLGMLYNLYDSPGTRRRSGEEHNRYEPWNNGGFHGFMEIEHQDSIYRIEKNFDKSKRDVLVYKDSQDITSKIPINEKREPDLGKELLGLGKGAFKNTFFLSGTSSLYGKGFNEELRERIANFGTGKDQAISVTRAKENLNRRLLEIGTDKSEKKELGQVLGKLEDLKTSIDTLKEGLEISSLLNNRVTELNNRRELLNRHRLLALEEELFPFIERLNQSERIQEQDNSEVIEALKEEINSYHNYDLLESSDMDLLKLKVQELDEAKSRIREEESQIRSLDEKIKEGKAGMNLFLGKDSYELVKEYRGIVDSNRYFELKQSYSLLQDTLSGSKWLWFMVMGLVFALLGVFSFVYRDALPNGIEPSMGTIITIGLILVALALLLWGGNLLFQRNQVKARLLKLGQEIKQSEKRVRDYKHRVDFILASSGVDNVNAYMDTYESAQLEESKIYRLKEQRYNLQSKTNKELSIINHKEQELLEMVQKLHPEVDISDLYESVDLIEQNYKDYLTLKERLDSLEATIAFSISNDDERNHLLGDAQELIRGQAKALLGDMDIEEFEDKLLETKEVLAIDASPYSLSDIDDELRDIDQQLSVALERQRAIGNNGLDEGELLRDYEKLTILRDELILEKDAIEIALQEIDILSREYSNEVLPSLSKEMAYYMSKLTKGKYTEIRLDDDFNIKVLIEGISSFKDISLLSSGTVEQIYLCFRLALCSILSKDVPIPFILDDPFGYYDNERLEEAMGLLVELSRERQIILLSCQDREREILDRLEIQYNSAKMPATLE